MHRLAVHLVCSVCYIYCMAAPLILWIANSLLKLIYI